MTSTSPFHARYSPYMTRLETGHSTSINKNLLLLPNFHPGSHTKATSKLHNSFLCNTLPEPLDSFSASPTSSPHRRIRCMSYIKVVRYVALAMIRVATGVAFAFDQYAISDPAMMRRTTSHCMKSLAGYGSTKFQTLGSLRSIFDITSCANVLALRGW